jgi:hypothetical protein
VNFVLPLLALGSSAALALTVALTPALAQSADPTLDLWQEIQRSHAVGLVTMHGPNSRLACDAIDPDERWQAEVELNQYAQRATELANNTSGGNHVRAMTLVRTIESAYNSLIYPVVPERCYVAPGA